MTLCTGTDDMKGTSTIWIEVCVEFDVEDFDQIFLD